MGRREKYKKELRCKPRRLPKYVEYAAVPVPPKKMKTRLVRESKNKKPLA